MKTDENGDGKGHLENITGDENVNNCLVSIITTRQHQYGNIFAEKKENTDKHIYFDTKL